MNTLVDIHCHGAVGNEFGVDEAGSRAAAAYHRDAGTGLLVASLVSATTADLERQVGVLAPLVADGTLAGIHLEGPFLSPARRGAHDPGLLTDPDPAVVDRLVSTVVGSGSPGAIKHWTFAPERPGAAEFVKACAAADILPAIGHTDASALEVSRILELITSTTGRPALVTHLFNGMPPMHHRAGGPVAAGLAAAARGEAVLELITDGVHVSPEVVQMVFETIGADRIALVSDAMAATGLGDGDYRLGSLAVTVSDGVARLQEGDSIAGSTATLADCVRWCRDVAGIPEDEVITAATTTPAAVLRLG